jgi:hypothetical protein
MMSRRVAKIAVGFGWILVMVTALAVPRASSQQPTHQQILNSVGNVQTGVNNLQSQHTSQTNSIQTLQQGLNAINQKLDALSATSVIPFTVQTAGGLCDSGPSPSSNPQILIEGTGSQLFVVTSILIKTAPQPSGQEGYRFLTTNSVRIDGTTFDTMTGNLVAAVSGFGVQESADLMGTPVRITSPSDLEETPRTASPSGANFPHQIVADSADSNDIRIQLFCRADTFDLSIDTVRVSGWRSPGDSVSVTYVPGN